MCMCLCMCMCVYVCVCVIVIFNYMFLIKYVNYISNVSDMIYLKDINLHLHSMNDIS